MKTPTLETPRLILRPAAPGLARAAAGYYRRNADWLQSVEPLHTRPLDSVRLQRQMMRQDARLARAGQGFRFWAFQKEAPEPELAVGCVALNNIVWGAFRSCFVAYKMDQALLRQGYGSEMVNAAAAFAFGIGLHRLEANIMPRNAPSLALARKCGFAEEGRSPAYLQVNGVWEEHIHMVRLAPEK